jgi:hypothetical protein
LLVKEETRSRDSQMLLYPLHLTTSGVGACRAQCRSLSSALIADRASGPRPRAAYSRLRRRMRKLTRRKVRLSASKSALDQDHQPIRAPRSLVITFDWLRSKIDCLDHGIRLGATQIFRLRTLAERPSKGLQ